MTKSAKRWVGGSQWSLEPSGLCVIHCPFTERLARRSLESFNLTLRIRAWLSGGAGRLQGVGAFLVLAPGTVHI